MFKLNNWIEFILTLPRIREHKIDEEVLYPIINNKPTSLEQAEAAKKLHEFIEKYNK